VFRKLLRDKPEGKAKTAAINNVKRFYEVHHQLRESFGQLDDSSVIPAYEVFLAWEAKQPQAALGMPNRVEFVPRVDETPFGVGDDFEKDFL
jgi:hypothetical protein